MNELFSEEEYRDRWQRAGAAMRAAGLDALLITAETNIFYFSGHRPVVPWDTATRATFCILPADADPVLLVHDVWAGGARADSPIRDIRSFGETTTLPQQLLVDCLRDLGLDHACIGAELGYEQRMGLAPNDFGALRNAAPHVRWADGADVFWSVRMIKSAAEVSHMRRACQINNAAFEWAFRRMTPETTETELAGLFHAGIALAGGEFGFMAPAFVPAAYKAMSRMPGSARIEPGKLVWNDLGARFALYWSDFARAAVLGRANDRQRSLWQRVHEVTQAGIEVVRPGRAPIEIVEACNRAAQRLGIVTNFASGRIGHGLGLMLTEPPHIAPYEQALLAPGMVITLEPGVINDHGVYIVEQNLLVTASGVEVLSSGRWEIWEIE
jgi:Xaa-Pro aminopeptidase